MSRKPAREEVIGCSAGREKAAKTPIGRSLWLQQRGNAAACLASAARKAIGLRLINFLMAGTMNMTEAPDLLRAVYAHCG